MPRQPLLLSLTCAALSSCSTDDGGRDEESAPRIEDAADDSRLMCPFCEVQTGGETSDFDGGSTSPCVAVSTRRPVTPEEADALGLDLAGALRRMQRGVDAPLYLRAGSVETTQAMASGYVEETRIEATISAGEAFVIELDPALCNDTVCRSADGEVEVDSSLCQTRLEIEFDAEIATTDGALVVTGSGTTHYWPREADEYFHAGTAKADLTAMKGSVTLSEPADPGPHYGTLLVDFHFKSDATVGDVRIQVTTVTGEHTTTQYYPLEGTWPDAWGEDLDAAPQLAEREE